MNRRLYRSPRDRVLAGVAGGMAETYDMDPSLVRVVWALLIIFTGGVFLILYIIMALVVPLGGEEVVRAYPADPLDATGGATETTEMGYGPAAPGAVPPVRRPAPRETTRGTGDNSGPLILGLLLIIVGGLFLLRQFVVIDIGRLWPLAVIAVGVLLIVGAFGRRERQA
jgi:phage shock protein C